MKFLIIVGVLGVLVWICYRDVRSDTGLLGDETLLKIVSNDVLGSRLYKETCPRSSYTKDIEIPAGPDKGEVAVFKFHPAPGMEVKCPPVSLIVDRRTAEAWIK